MERACTQLHTCSFSLLLKTKTSSLEQIINLYHLTSPRWLGVSSRLIHCYYLNNWLIVSSILVCFSKNYSIFIHEHRYTITATATTMILIIASLLLSTLHEAIQLRFGLENYHMNKWKMRGLVTLSHRFAGWSVCLHDLPHGRLLHNMSSDRILQTMLRLASLMSTCLFSIHMHADSKQKHPHDKNDQ